MGRPRLNKYAMHMAKGLGLKLHPSISGLNQLNDEYEALCRGEDPYDPKKEIMQYQEWMCVE